MPSSAIFNLEKGLWLMSLNNLESETLDTSVTNDFSKLGVAKSASIDFDFLKPAFDFVAHSKFKDEFEDDGGVTNVLSKFVHDGEKLSVENYKSVMKFMPMIEFWEEFRIAEENTEPRNTFFANIKIDVST